MIIIPGSKSTVADLAELRRNGVAQAVIQAHKRGATVLGICGGFQIMGMEVLDPNHIEGEIERLPGLRLLPVSTVITQEKVTLQSNFRALPMEENLSGGGYYLKGYEIHMGESVPFEGEECMALNELEDGRKDGCYVSQKCMGTYMHGILDNGVFIDWLLAPYAAKSEAHEFDYSAFKEEQYNKLAAAIRENVDMDLLYKIMGRDD